jgi:hypothetical protein
MALFHSWRGGKNKERLLGPSLKISREQAQERATALKRVALGLPFYQLEKKG